MKAWEKLAEAVDVGPEAGAVEELAPYAGPEDPGDREIWELGLGLLAWAKGQPETKGVLVAIRRAERMVALAAEGQGAMWRERFLEGDREVFVQAGFVPAMRPGDELRGDVLYEAAKEVFHDAIKPM